MSDSLRLDVAFTRQKSMPFSFVTSDKVNLVVYLSPHIIVYMTLGLGIGFSVGFSVGCI